MIFSFIAWVYWGSPEIPVLSAIGTAKVQASMALAGCVGIVSFNAARIWNSLAGSLTRE
jgi:hypothetical protein